MAYQPRVSRFMRVHYFVIRLVIEIDYLIEIMMTVFWSDHTCSIGYYFQG